MISCAVTSPGAPSSGSELPSSSTSGGPLPDEIITAVVRDRLQRGTSAGFLLVGHPSSTTQALALDELLRELGKPLDGVLHLQVSEVAEEHRPHRPTSRRLCNNNPRGRLRSHRAMVEPITRHYARQGLLVTVDAGGTPDDMARRAVIALREHGS